MVCAGWWRQIFGDREGSAHVVGGPLRRCDTPAEALAIESVHDLNSQLRAMGYRPGADRLALVAISLAHVNENGILKLAEAFGQRKPRRGARVLSELRFQALIHATDWTALITPLRRALASVRGKPVNVAALAADLYRWDEHSRTAWCFQYYGASEAVPAQIETHHGIIEA